MKFRNIVDLVICSLIFFVVVFNNNNGINNGFVCAYSIDKHLGKSKQSGRVVVQVKDKAKNDPMIKTTIKKSASRTSSTTQSSINKNIHKSVIIQNIISTSSAGTSAPCKIHTSTLSSPRPFSRSAKIDSTSSLVSRNASPANVPPVSDLPTNAPVTNDPPTNAPPANAPPASLTNDPPINLSPNVPSPTASPVSLSPLPTIIISANAKIPTAVQPAIIIPVTSPSTNAPTPNASPVNLPTTQSVNTSPETSSVAPLKQVLPTDTQPSQSTTAPSFSIPSIFTTGQPSTIAEKTNPFSTLSVFTDIQTPTGVATDHSETLPPPSQTQNLATLIFPTYTPTSISKVTSSKVTLTTNGVTTVTTLLNTLSESFVGVTSSITPPSSQTVTNSKTNKAYNNPANNSNTLGPIIGAAVVLAATICLAAIILVKRRSRCNRLPLPDGDSLEVGTQTGAAGMIEVIRPPPPVKLIDDDDSDNGGESSLSEFTGAGLPTSLMTNVTGKSKFIEKFE